MRRIESQLDVNSRGFPAQPGAQPAAGRGVARTGAPRALRAPAARSRSARAAKEDVRPRPYRDAARSRHSVSGVVNAGGEPGVRRRSAERRAGQRYRRGQRPRSDHSRRRRERQGRRVVSALGQKDRAHAGYRDRKPPAGDPSVRQRRRISSAAGAFFRRSLLRRAHLPQPMHALTRWACRKSQSCSATARRAAPIFRRSATIQGHRARHGSDFPGRPAAGEGGDRGGSQRRRTGRMRPAYAVSAAPPIIPRTARKRRSRSPATSWRGSSARKRPPNARSPSRHTMIRPSSTE